MFSVFENPNHLDVGPPELSYYSSNLFISVFHIFFVCLHPDKCTQYYIPKFLVIKTLISKKALLCFE